MHGCMDARFDTFLASPALKTLSYFLSSSTARPAGGRVLLQCTNARTVSPLSSASVFCMFGWSETERLLTMLLFTSCLLPMCTLRSALS